MKRVPVATLTAIALTALIVISRNWIEHSLAHKLPGTAPTVSKDLHVPPDWRQKICEGAWQDEKGLLMINPGGTYLQMSDVTVSDSLPDPRVSYRLEASIGTDGNWTLSDATLTFTPKPSPRITVNKVEVDVSKVPATADPEALVRLKKDVAAKIRAEFPAKYASKAQGLPVTYTVVKPGPGALILRDLRGEEVTFENRW